MKPSTKLLTMLVTVRVPADLSPSDARREVRTLITDKTTYDLFHDDIKATAVRAAPRNVAKSR
jgi:hypothetical protein